MGWRAGNGSGIYPNERGLLKQWPEKGPAKLFTIEGLANGYSQPAITENRIFITGLRDTMDVVMAFDKQGNKLWETPYGKAWIRSYELSRSTPRIEGNRIWVTSGMAQMACLDLKTGKVLWHKDLYTLYEGEEATFGYSESPVIWKNLVFYTIGGKKATVVALDKTNGKEVWRSEVFDKSAYASPIIINHNGTEMYVNVGAKFIFALSAKDGKTIWIVDYSHWANPQDTNNNTNNPIYIDGKIVVTSGYDHGTVQLILSKDGKQVETKWKNEDLDAHHGNIVKVGDYLYGSTWDNNNAGGWACIEWKTGKTKYITKWENKGSVISADGMLYCYEERRGNMALVKPNPEKFDIISYFRIEGGRGPHWAHPVIDKGILYVRHGDVLNAYDIKN